MEYLPFDCLIYIFDYLSMQDIISLRKTCTTFAEVVKYIRCRDDVVVYNKYEDAMYNGEMIYGFMNCRLPNIIEGIKFTSYHNVKCDFNLHDISIFGDVRNLMTRGVSFSSKPTKIRHITLRKLNINDIGDNIITIQSDNCKNSTISGLSNLVRLELNKCENLQVVRDMQSLKTLRLEKSDIKELHNLPSLTNLTLQTNNAIDISHITTLKRLNISDSKCLLPTIERLDLLDCSNNFDVRDVKIKYIDKLKCLNCRHINISYLSYVRSLDISATNITDISMFGYVETLKIVSTNIESIPVPNKIIKLIAHNSKLKSIGYAKYLEDVDISDTEVTSIPENNIREFVAIGCPITNIDTLTKAEFINMNHSKLESLPANNSIINIQIRHTNVTNIDYLIRAEKVDIGYTKVNKLPNFTHITKLNIDGTKINSIPNLPKLKNLHIENTISITDVTHLTNLVKLHASHSAIRSLKGLTKLKFLTIENRTLSL